VGTSRHIYVGKYLRAWLPTKEVENQHRRKCPKCDTIKYSSFCEQCGTETVPTTEERRLDQYELFEELFDYGDQFFTQYLCDRGYEVVLPNLRGQPGGVSIEEQLETPIPKEELTGDWEVLMRAYRERGIKFEQAEGVFVYYL